MPGENCSVYGCGTSRKHKGVSIWKLPSASNSFNSEWRAKLLNLITRDRLMDESFKKQLDADRIYICERHFSQEQLYICKYIFLTDLYIPRGYLAYKEKLKLSGLAKG